MSLPVFQEVSVTRKKWIPDRLVLETPCLPCGDFDGPALHLPGEPFRSYRTSQGYRIFLIRRVVASVEEVLPLFRSMGADPKYLSFCRLQQNFRMRVSPKQQDGLGQGQAICTLLGQVGEALPEWGGFIARHDELCLRTGATLLV